MNQSVLSDEFGQQIESLTTGTKYEVDSETDEKMDHTEMRIRAIMYNLWMDAKSKKLADFLQKKQAAHFAELYEFSYGVPMYDSEYSPPRDAESLALMIIDEKQAFIKRNEHLYLRYERFKNITNDFPTSSKQVLVDYFEHSKKMDYELLRNTLKKHLRVIELIYQEDEDSKEADADEQEDERQAALGCEGYLIDRKKVYMTPEEYELHKVNEKYESNKLYERLGFLMS